VRLLPSCPQQTCAAPQQLTDTVSTEPPWQQVGRVLLQHAPRDEPLPDQCSLRPQHCPAAQSSEYGFRPGAGGSLAIRTPTQHCWAGSKHVQVEAKPG